uniref:Ion_trans_2 domain-containing protein n=1 Tax=Globodera pallida TaxID=36090 RepID=A0A183BT58_GLOPA
MFYAGQLYTTIGYGIPITQTSGGRLASIAYIMVGIPLFLLILTEIGRLLARGLRKLYKKLHAARKKLPEASRKMSEPMRAIYHITAAMAGTAVGSAATPLINGAARGELLREEEAKQREAERRNAQKALEKLKKDSQRAQEKGEEKPRQFPIPWALTILIVWTLLSAALFCVWETEWGYMTSIYFFFVSISTVGLGDLVPTNPDMMIVNFFMILIGLALLSMCIDLIQKALQKLIERLIEQYIDEIEKMASEVVNVQDEEEAPEDIPPFLPETAAVLTEGESRRGSNARRKSSTIGRVKDWLAERASNILVNKIYPEESSESDSEPEDQLKSTEVAEDFLELEAVVVEREPLLNPGTALNVQRAGVLVQRIDHQGKEVEMIIPDRRVSFGSIVQSQQGSIGKRKQKKAPKLPKNYAGALLRYDPSKIQAGTGMKMHP